MLNVTHLEKADLGILDSLYVRGLSRYRKSTKDLSPRKQRKLRQFLMKECADQYSQITPEIREYLTSCTDTDFFAFLRECIKERTRRCEAERDRMNERFAVFGEKVHFAACELSGGHLLPPWSRQCARGSRKLFMREDTRARIRAL